MKKIILIGGDGHCKSVIDGIVIKENNFIKANTLVK
tara:strand:- start:19 stop:126 length:108 start_codon:yes stop_codon:yes gene_type:complete